MTFTQESVTTRILRHCKLASVPPPIAPARSGQEVIQIRFAPKDCRACEVRPACTRAKTQPRTLLVRPQLYHEALQTMRQRQLTAEFQEPYAARAGEVFLKLKVLLEPFGLTHYYTDKWGAYTRHLDPKQHTASKRSTQKIEHKHLTLRTRIKRLVRKTICFSKSTQMHDIVIGLFVNRYAFGRSV